MCAADYNHNGNVDAFYFEDTKEVFLYREEAQTLVKQYRNFHICAQIIDEELAESADKLLAIDEDTSYLKVAAIKSDLLVNYLRYTPRVNRCNKEHGREINLDEPDDFAIQR